MADDNAPEIHRFRASVTWEGDGSGSGEARVAEDVSIPIGSAVSLGGSGRGTNAEELFLASVGTCFIGTWAIFLKKLGIGYAEPSLSVDGSLEKDPAGGYRLTSIEITCAVPQPLLDRERPAVEKTLQLAEKYCIVSKVARAAMPVRVTIAAI